MTDRPSVVGRDMTIDLGVKTTAYRNGGHYGEDRAYDLRCHGSHRKSRHREEHRCPQHLFVGWRVYRGIHAALAAPGVPVINIGAWCEPIATTPSASAVFEPSAIVNVPNFLAFL
jgi:hypothetical protein